MTPHLAAVLNTDEPAVAPTNELLDLVMMVSDSAWQAKDYAAAKRAALMALSLDCVDDAAMNRRGRIALLERDYLLAINYFGAVKRTPAALVNMAIADGCLRQFELALIWCDRAIEMDAAFLPAYIHKAAILEETDRLAEAEQAVLDALAIAPDNSELLYALSLYQLKRGDFANGWANYEQRPPRLELARKLDEYPEWQGESLEDKTILVCGEQGLGDQIMFARYIPLLRAERMSCCSRCRNWRGYSANLLKTRSAFWRAMQN